MPDCFCVADAGARCSSARAATEASAIAEHVAAAPLGVNRCARRDAGVVSHIYLVKLSQIGPTGFLTLDRHCRMYCRAPGIASSRYAAPALRFGPLGDAMPGARREVPMAASTLPAMGLAASLTGLSRIVSSTSVTS